MLRDKSELHAAIDKCIKAFENLIDFKSKNFDNLNTEMEFGIRLNLALIYETIKQFEEAKQMYKEIIQQDSYYNPGIQYQCVRVNLGNIYFIKLEYKKAITEWKRAIDKIGKDTNNCANYDAQYRHSAHKARKLIVCHGQLHRNYEKQSRREDRNKFAFVRFIYGKNTKDIKRF